MPENLWALVRQCALELQDALSPDPAEGLPCVVFFISLLLIVAAEVAAFVLVGGQVG